MKERDFLKEAITHAKKARQHLEGNNTVLAYKFLEWAIMKLMAHEAKTAKSDGVKE